MNEHDLGLLKYIVHKVRSKDLSQDYVRGVGFEILPLVKHVATELHNKWIGQIEGYITKTAELEMQAMHQIRECMTNLKQNLVISNVHDTKISRIIAELEDILADKAVFIMPSPLQLAWEHYNQILYRLCSLNQLDILKKYATISYNEKNTKSPSIEAILGLSKFQEYHKTTNSFESNVDQNVDENIWKSYEYLMQLRWSLRRSKIDKSAHDPYDFFRKKLLYHQQTSQCSKRKDAKKYKNLTKKNLTSKHAKRDAVLMDLYFRYLEVRAMENDTPLVISETITFSEVKDPRLDILFEGVQMIPINLEPILAGTIVENSLYTREKIYTKLNIVLNHIYQLNTHISDEITPQIIELTLDDDTYLCLKVTWQNNIISFFTMHNFQEAKHTDNELQMFIENLLDTNSVILDKCSASGVNATKYLRRIGIFEILDEIFVAQKTAFTVKLSSKSIEVEKLSPDMINRLLQHMNNLEFRKWEF